MADFDIASLKEQSESLQDMDLDKPEIIAAPAADAGEKTDAEKAEALEKETKEKEAADALAKQNEGKTAEQIETEKKAAEAEAERLKNDPAAAKEAADKLEKEAADKREAEAEKKAEEKLFKKYGVKNAEELDAKLKTPESPEEIEKKKEQHIAAVDSFAQEKGYMKREEIIALENLKKAEPLATAYNAFAKDYLEKNKDATQDQIKQEFDLFYHLNSTNEVLKNQGEVNAKKLHDNEVARLESKRTAAQEAYDTANSEKARVPEFKTMVQTAIKNSVPDEIEIFKDGDTPIKYKITPENRAAAEKFLVNNENFQSFLQAKEVQPIQKQLEDAAAGFLFLTHKDSIMKTIFDAGKSAGAKDGSDTGAKAAFEQKQDADKVEVDETKLSDGDLSKISGLFGGGR